MKSDPETNLNEERAHDDIPEGKLRPWKLMYVLVAIALAMQILLFSWLSLHFK